MKTGARKVLKKHYKVALTILTIANIFLLFSFGILGRVQFANLYVPTVIILSALSIVNVHVLDKFGR